VRSRLAIAVAGLLALAAVLAASSGAAAQSTPPSFSNPVVAGQYADPTVLRDGDTYYLSATSRSWAPLFPLLRSTDLVHWERLPGALPAAPAWASAPFWAPELVRWDDETRLYYTARPRRDIHAPCIGVARAPAPAGPFTDAGAPLLCPPDGAIDPYVAPDAHGNPYLIYRRFNGDGGIWAQQLRADGLAVTGPERLLMAVGPEDEGVVEGPAVIEHEGSFFLTFATRNCCRPPCDYVQAVARADALLGPYVRAPALALTGTRQARCPGHGTPVEDPAGGAWFLHHAVLADDPVNARRNVFLEPLHWGLDGWPVLGDAGRPLLRAAAPPGRATAGPVPLTPKLAGPALDPGWEWLWDRPARAVQRGGRLLLGGDPRGVVLARQVTGAVVRAEVRATARGCTPGLAAVQGGEAAGEAIGVERLADGRVRVWRGTAGAGPGRTLATVRPPGRPGAAATLALTVRDSRLVRLSVRAGGRTVPLGGAVATKPNRRVLRLALTCRGARGGQAAFDRLRISR
jgi:xylan 1,4-beta-xylosidase